MEIEMLGVMLILLGLLQVLALPIMVISQEVHCNLTIIIYDFSGKKPLFEPPSALPLVILQKGDKQIGQLNATYNQTVTFCKFVGLEPGDYKLAIYWKGILVYRNDNVSMHENVTLTVRCNVSSVTFTIVDGVGNTIPYAKIELYYQETGTQIGNVTADNHGCISSLLPFGYYAIVSAFVNVEEIPFEVPPLNASFIKVNSSGTYILTVRGGVQDYLTLGVFPLSLEILTYKMNSLSSDIAKKIKLVLFKDETELLQLSLNESEVYIKQLPLGTYYVEFFWSGYPFDKKMLNHYSSTKKSLGINLHERVEMYFVDETGIPLANIKVTIIAPWGEKWNFTTDMQGKIELINVPFGNYTALVQIKDDLPVELTIPVSSSTLYREEIKGFLTITLHLERKSEYDKNLPSGIKLKLFINEKIINETILNGTVIVFRNIPKGLLRLYLEWQGVVVGSLEEELMFPKELVARCGIYELGIVLKDLDDELVKGCLVRIHHPNGTQLEQVTDSSGAVRWKYLPNGEYSVVVMWNGTVVHEEKIHLFSDLVDKMIVIRLKTFCIKIVDVLGQSVPGAEITLTSLVSESNISQVLSPTTTLQSSFIFKKVFLLTDTYKLTVKVKGTIVKTEVIKLGKGVDEIVVTCPVFTFLGMYIITKYDVPLIIIITITTTLLIFVSIKYWRLLQLRHIFVEGLPEEERKIKAKTKLLVSVPKLRIERKSEEFREARPFFKPPVMKESYGKLEEYEEEYEEYEEYEELFE